MLQLRSPREIALMRRAGLVVWHAHQAALPLIQPGVTTRELDQAVETVFRQAGAVPLFKGVPGAVPFPASTCISVNDEIVHGIPGDRVLRAGDIVSVDTGCKVDGWCGDAAFTYPVGQVAPRIRRLLDVTERALNLAIDQLRHARRWVEVARQIQQFVEHAGFSVVEEFVGHGIGREMHEPPQIPNFVPTVPDKDRQFDFPIRPGLVLAIEPMVNLGRKEVRRLPDQWTLVTVDGLPSAHFEHTVALTAEGPVRLTGPPTDGDP